MVERGQGRETWGAGFRCTPARVARARMLAAEWANAAEPKRPPAPGTLLHAADADRQRMGDAAAVARKPGKFGETSETCGTAWFAGPPRARPLLGNDPRVGPTVGPGPRSPDPGPCRAAGGGFVVWPGRRRRR